MDVGTEQENKRAWGFQGFFRAFRACRAFLLRGFRGFRVCGFVSDKVVWAENRRKPVDLHPKPCSKP